MTDDKKPTTPSQEAEVNQGRDEQIASEQWAQTVVPLVPQPPPPPALSPAVRATEGKVEPIPPGTK